MFEKILVPLDGSVLAEIVLPYAMELAGRLGSDVTLVYVNELREAPYQHMCQFYLEKMVKATKQGTERWTKEPTGSAIQVRSAILVGNPAERIVEHADEEDVGLVLVATHGQSGIKHWPLGSVADKVVRATKRPVMLIRAKGARPDAQQKSILNRVLIPLDGSKEGETVVPYIAELASKLKAEAFLFQVLAQSHRTISADGHVYFVYPEKQMELDKTLAEDYLDIVGARLKRQGVTVKSEVRFGSAAEEIINFTGEINADVVAMSTHGRSGVGRWVFGSVADRVLHEGNTPLLLVRAAGGVN